MPQSIKAAVTRFTWNAATGKMHSASASSTAPIFNFVFIVSFLLWAAAHLFLSRKSKRGWTPDYSDIAAPSRRLAFAVCCFTRSTGRRIGELLRAYIAILLGREDGSTVHLFAHLLQNRIGQCFRRQNVGLLTDQFQMPHLPHWVEVAPEAFLFRPPHKTEIFPNQAGVVFIAWDAPESCRPQYFEDFTPHHHARKAGSQIVYSANLRATLKNILQSEPRANWFRVFEHSNRGSPRDPALNPAPAA